MGNNAGNNSEIRSIYVGNDGYWRINGQKINIMETVLELSNNTKFFAQENIPTNFKLGDKWLDTSSGILSEARLINNEYVMWVDVRSDNNSMPLNVIQEGFDKIMIALNKLKDGLQSLSR